MWYWCTLHDSRLFLCCSEVNVKAVLSLSLSFGLSRSAQINKRAFCLGTKCTFCQNDSSLEFYHTLSHFQHWRFSSINLLRFLNVISKLFPCCGIISCFVHNWFYLANICLNSYSAIWKQLRIWFVQWLFIWMKHCSYSVWTINIIDCGRWNWPFTKLLPQTVIVHSQFSNHNYALSLSHQVHIEDP